MKKLLFGLLAVVCFSAIISWQNIEGNGNLKKETRTVSDFSGIENHGGMNVIITYGTSNQITVEADDNLLPYIETKVNGNNLVVKSADKISYNTHHKITVTVQIKNITELAVSGSGSIMGNGAFANSGDTKMSVSGSGNINLGFADFNNLKTAITGSGFIKLSEGKLNNIDATVSGSGQFNAVEIACNNVKAKVSGSGSMKVTCSNSIDAHVTGSGSIHYKGNPINVMAKTSGSGKIVKM